MKLLIATFLTTSFWLAGGADAVLAASATTTTEKAPILTYIPPKRGAPTTRVGGGTRSSSYSYLTLTALAPNHTGHTVSTTPALFWYVSETIDTPVEITVSVEDAIEPLVEVVLDQPIAKGMHAVRLNDYGVALQSDRVYEWFVAVVRDPNQRSKDILAGGSIQRVLMTGYFRDQLNQSEQNEWPAIYAEAGLWYDAIEGISSQIESAPTDRTLREQRASLLDQVGLVEAAAYDRRSD